MAADRSWSVLLVDTEAGFVDDTKGLLSDHVVHTARNMSDAQRRLVEETIEVAVVGPGYGRTDAVREITSLFELKPHLPVIVVSDEMTTELLRTAMRLGIKDVLGDADHHRQAAGLAGLLDRQI